MSYINKMHNVVIGATAVTSVAVILAGCHKQSHQQLDCSSLDSMDDCAQRSSCAWLEADPNMLVDHPVLVPGHCVARDFCDGILNRTDCVNAGCYYNIVDQYCALDDLSPNPTNHTRPHCPNSNTDPLAYLISSDNTSCVEKCAIGEYFGSDDISCVKECAVGEYIYYPGPHNITMPHCLLTCRGGLYISSDGKSCLDRCPDDEYIHVSSDALSSCVKKCPAGEHVDTDGTFCVINNQV